MSDVIFYFDYKSPFTYLAKDPAYALEQDFGVRVDWRPYVIDLPAAHGDLETRSARDWAKVKYLYMDVRRWANKRGLIVRGPKKIFDSSIAIIGALYAQQQDAQHGRQPTQGLFRTYNDLVFERFWQRELDIEDVEVVRDALTEAGANGDGFSGYLAGDGRAEQERIVAEADSRGVFGVPSFIYRDELFWGHDRIALLRERLAEG